MLSPSSLCYKKLCIRTVQIFSNSTSPYEDRLLQTKDEGKDRWEFPRHHLKFYGILGKRSNVSYSTQGRLLTGSPMYELKFHLCFLFISIKRIRRKPVWYTCTLTFHWSRKKEKSLIDTFTFFLIQLSIVQNCNFFYELAKVLNICFISRRGLFWPGVEVWGPQHRRQKGGHDGKQEIRTMIYLTTSC